MARVAELEVRVVGPAPAAAATTVVLLHGFGAPGDDLVSLARVIHPPPATRFVFPAAPLSLAGMFGDARAWWMLDLARFERLRAGRQEDRSAEIPEGLAEARALVEALLDEVVGGGGAERLVLGGFSQGAMLALDVALQSRHPVAGLALMSGTLINGAAWRARLDRLRGTPVLMSHGRADPLLPFSAATTLRDELRAAGADVDWIEFAGGHEIPPPVIAGLDRLLARVAG